MLYNPKGNFSLLKEQRRQSGADEKQWMEQRMYNQLISSRESEIKIKTKTDRRAHTHRERERVRDIQREE